VQLNIDIQSEALPSLFCFRGLFRLIFGRGDYRFYDSISRLIEADYNKGTTIYSYGYDPSGNLVNFDGVTRTYNAANQMTNDGTNTLTYDNNGNLTGNGTDTYTWDRANRLLSVGNHSYAYDGLSNRIQQTVSSVVTDYLNDVQPGLTKLLKQDDGTNVEHFVHAVRGIHAVDVNYGTDWNYYAQDGLGSVRAMVDDTAVVQSSVSFDPYGNPMSPYGEGFGFTGEQTDANGSVFLRARYYEPAMGTFIKRDPAETPNRYAYVSGNPVNMIDPSGLTGFRIDDGGAWKRFMQQMNVDYHRASGNSLPSLAAGFNSGFCGSSSSGVGKSLRGKIGGGFYTDDPGESGVGTSDCSCYSEQIWYAGDFFNPRAECEAGNLPTCAEIPLPQCGGANSKLNSAVYITIYNISPSGNVLDTTISLGTYTTSGIWTHDHFVPVETIDPVTNITSFTPLEDNQAFLNGSTTLVAFEGPNGRVISSGSTLNIQVASDMSSRGSLLISENIEGQLFEFSGDDPVAAMSGFRTPSSFAEIGLQEAPTQNAARALNDILLRQAPPLLEYVFVPGENSLTSSWSDLCVGTGVFLSIGGASGSVSNAIRYLARLGFDQSPGDSGGGIFVNDNLIGVTSRAEYLAQDNVAIPSTTSQVAHFLHTP